ncbi:DUF6783 domain-containing protein [Blautia faecicola]|uniref:DUF6783 domain-containing protein n=1 Tax=Blautia faecicola TaxID=2509240 RepID=UPI002FE61CD9
MFYLRSVDVARYAALIQEKSPTNCDAHLAESLFQTRSSRTIKLRPHRQAPKKATTLRPHWFPPTNSSLLTNSG